MFCKNCGEKLSDGTKFCPECGAAVKAAESDSNARTSGFTGPAVEENTTAPAEETTSSNGPENASEEKSAKTAEAPKEDPKVTERSTGFMILSFLWPILGLILWLVWSESQPGKAISAAKGALASVCMSIPLLGLILFLVWKDDESKAEIGKAAGIGAIIGFASAVVLPIVVFVFSFLITLLPLIFADMSMAILPFALL